MNMMNLASSSFHQINHLAAVLLNCNSNSIRTLGNTWGSKSCIAVVTNKKDHATNPLHTTCCNSKLNDEEEGIRSVKAEEDDMMMRKTFEEVYSVLKSQLLNDPLIEWTHDSRQWLNQMMDYNVPGGKITRGLSVIDSYKSLKQGKELSEEEVFDACVIGWCMELLQACGLMLDDIMDNSHTRRGQPCWFRIPKVGNIAINDGILKKYFREKPYYVELLDLVGEVNFQTASGQMLDITTTARHKDLSEYSLQLYRHIAQYKTGFYTFYLPVACALLLAGENRDEHGNVKDVLLDMGIYFQVVDDYLDCFGDPETTGKIGTDIEDFKCTWLVVKALELCNEQQKKILNEHYGKANPDDVAKVKGVYNDINLREVFVAYERESYDKITACVEAHPNKAVRAIWERTVS